MRINHQQKVQCQIIQMRINQTFVQCQIIIQMSHLSSHMGAEDLPLGGHQQVDVLHHVQEQFVPPVLDTLLPPPNLPCYLVEKF